jgi:DNA-binding GntR family transcriptional regulator
MGYNIVVEGLRNEILSGMRQPGSALLQSQIAKQYNVSRIPVRDALATLAIERLVMSQPNMGARVVELTMQELCEVFELRISLECKCLEAAMENMDKTHIEEVTYQLQKSSIEAQRAGWARSDAEFHNSLYMAANRPVHIRLISELRQLCQIHTKHYAKLTQNTDHWVSQHAEITEAFQKGNVQLCVTLLEQHLSQARDFLLSEIKSSSTC